MGFFNVLGLISLIAVPAVIILHMLKRKQKRRTYTKYVFVGKGS